MDVRRAEGGEREAAVERLVDEWGDPIRARDESYALGDCDIWVAGAMEGLAAVSLRDRPIAELVAINAFTSYRGVGTALIDALAASLPGCEALRLTTTNDNLDALRFYQRRGFRLLALRAGAVDAARVLKPSIPEIGDYRIPVRDEIDLILDLKPIARAVRGG